MAEKAKIALVTGANKGIGYEVSRQLAEKGYTVLLGARDVKLGEAAAAKLQGNVSVIHIDLASPETSTAAARQIEEKYGVLDVLVNNAGMIDWTDGPPSTTKVDAVRKIFDTNFFGTIEVTQAFLPLVKKSSAGRIVNVSSGLGSLAQNGDTAWPFAEVKALGYCSSKAALNMMTVQLAYELRATPVKVNSADPGYTDTDLNNHGGHQTVAEGSEAIVRLATLDENGPTGGYFDRNGRVPW
ncbi:SDR family oxidoreductase [Terriglobus roseus]|uniref:Short-chain dehydrogenase n=1 Tax=Terriglobus roseus TaxID=392734 RepID=A0A1H4R6K4_9BACT|nr:SDR family oxidoreductase [Terriglobus roseus]SEC27446.1 Short-chain dehydrogenase [Terriglobus roseus]